MVWRMMAAAGCSTFVRLQETVNAEVYKQILQQHAIPLLQFPQFQPQAFSQNNTLCHNSEKVKLFLVDNRVQVMDRPAKSPDDHKYNLWKIISCREPTHNLHEQKDHWELFL